MANTTLAYYRLKPPASIMNGRIRRRRVRREAAGPADRTSTVYSLVSLAVRALAYLVIVLLAGAAQAQRPTAATHIVRPGETLGLIAQQYGVDIFTLASANGIKDAHSIFSWQQLTIPADSSEADATLVARGRHIVRHGETLGSIARQYGIALSDLIKLNNIFGWIYPGDELALPVAGQASAPVQTDPPVTAAADSVTHIVRAGDSLGTIAAAYGVSLYDLRAANNIWSWIIYAGQELKIPPGGKPPSELGLPAESVTLVDTPATVELVEASGITHKVQVGESLAKIAAAYGVSLYDLQTLNDIWSSILYVGHELEIPAGGSPVRESERPAEPATPEESPAPEEPELTVEASGITHKVKFGESLAKIAAAYGVSLYDLQTLNDIWSSILYVGHELEIPAGGSPDRVSERPAEPATPDESPAPEEPEPQVEASGITHRVKFGESMAKIAEAYGVSLYDLQTLNDIWSSILYVGHELEIPAGGSPVLESNVLESKLPAEPATPEESPAPKEPEPQVEASGITHKVKFGESLAKIAAAYGVSLYDLQALNDVWTWVIFVGQELEIPAGGRAPDTQDAPPEPEPEPTADNTSPSTQPKTHTVQRGETLFSIAKRYGVSLDALMRANGIEDVTRIHAGNTLRVSHLDSFAPPAATNDASSPAPAQAAPPAAPAGRALPVVTTMPAPGIYPAGDLGQQYTVGRGEYLTELGVRFNMEWRVLAKINGIIPPYALHHQQTLRIPSFAEYLSYLPDNSSYKLFYTTHHHPGPRVGVGREIVIELGRQSIYAYENGVLQKRALISSGKMMTPTVQGDYKIYLKYRSQTMSGPGYSLDNVEWPMYFHAGYAIHGTWWHTMFGTPMSHGCVNLTNADAQWFWEFAPLGTPVHVRV